MGMIDGLYELCEALKSCPHTHGDDPQVLPLGTALAELVPTRVGMIPIAGASTPIGASCPHTRGDDPNQGYFVISERCLSPHAWG